MKTAYSMGLWLSLVLWGSVTAWAQKPAVVEITQREGVKEYKVMSQEEVKVLEKDVLLENDAMPYAYIRTQVYWRTNIMRYPVSAKGSKDKPAPAPKTTEDGRVITFELDRPEPKLVRVCGFFEDESSAAAKIAMFSELETQRREKEKKEAEVKKSRMSAQKIAALTASEASQKALRAWCYAQAEIIKDLMKKGKFNDERELLYNWQGQPITKPSIPRRVGDSLDPVRDNLVNMNHLVKVPKKLPKKPIRMVNTAKARKEREEKAAAAAEYVPKQ